MEAWPRDRPGQIGGTGTISLYIRYKGEKARLFNQWKDDTQKYIESFVNEDIEALGLPQYHSCESTWRSAAIKCVWTITHKGPLEGTILSAFQNVRSYPTLLADRFMSLVSMSIRGSRLHIPAPGLRAPSDFISPASGAQSPSALYWPTSGKAPSATTSIARARAAASPLSRPAGSSTAQPSATTSRSYSPSFSPAPPSVDQLPRTRVGQTASASKGLPLRSKLAANGSKQTSATPSKQGDRPPTPQAQAGMRVPMNKDTQPSSLTFSQPQIKIEERNNDHALRQSSIASRAASSSIRVPPASTSPSMPTPPGPSAQPVEASTNAAPERQWGASAIVPLTDKLEACRQQITTLVAREKVLARRLVECGVHPPPEPSVMTTKEVVKERKTLQDEISAMRAQLHAESEARRTAESALHEERGRRELAEGAMIDVRRECNAPFIVPALMDAFLGISRLTGELLSGGAEH
ncbi:hypothetical protein EVJ58_g9213 [Rhodofomes roseus]|uniref:Uncharacterized protein n=1 Tax=Rhodofomes roseus TaxID=34475 RepID=A0A4Y9XWT2_9APHY|nr:hypothetical protein EVJ58_g9213 [Rhodofomes roseus]